METLRAELRHFDFLLEASRRITRELSLTTEHPVQGIPLALLRVDVLQLRQCCGVVRLQTDDALERLRRLIQIAKSLGPESRDTQVQLHLLFGFGGDLSLAIENVNELVPPPSPFVELRQRGQRFCVVGRQRLDLAVHLDEHGIELERITVDRNQIAEQPQLLFLGVGRQCFDLTSNRLGQGIPLAAVLVQLLKGGPRVEIAGRQPLDELPGFQGAFRPVRLLRPMSELPCQYKLAIGVSRSAKRVAEDDEQTAVCVLVPDPRAIEIQHARMSRIDLAQASKERLSGLRVLAKAPMNHRELEQHALFSL